MGCSICIDLERALVSRHGEYIGACSGVLRRFSSKFAAYDLVEMERARSELEAHRSVCVSAVAAPAIQHSLPPAS
ncbi:MAG: hypothetical protein ACLQG3_06595 [Terracidiphilus sp.]